MEKGKVGYFDVRKFFYNHWDNLPRDPDQLELLIKYCKSISCTQIYFNTRYTATIFGYTIKEEDCVMQ